MELALKTIDNAVRIIDYIEQNDGAQLFEIANEVGMPSSTVHGYVRSLERNGYLVRRGNEYHIGLLFLRKGGYVRRNRDYYTETIETVESIARQTGERAQFIVEEHGRGIYVHTAIGKSGVQTDSYIGKRNYLHSSAVGKSILASMDEAEIREIIDQWGLPELTPNTITDERELQRELTEIREQRYSLNDEEYMMGLRAVGVPITYDDGTVFGGISISGPKERMRRDKFDNDYPNFLLSKANEIELLINST